MAEISRWPDGSATGVGSHPGLEIADAVKFVLGELPIPYLPELPARGPGADLIGRGTGLLTDLPVELYAARWRAAARPGRDLRRTLDLLERDLDVLTEAADGYAGPLKLQAPGPWTLAAGVDLLRGGPVLRDHGAVHDLVASLGEGLAAHVADVQRRVPGATVLLQLDEPTLPAVLAGRVPTESGLGALSAVGSTAAQVALRSVIEGVPVPVVVHCCAAEVPVRLLVGAGAAAVSLDISLLRAPQEWDAIGAAVDSGVVLFAGTVPTSPDPLTGRPPDSAAVATRVEEQWRRLGFPLERLPGQVVVTPACGLAGASQEYARACLGACVEAGRRLAELQA
jgi:methionine synthase II (cobalamin-independent)